MKAKKRSGVELSGWCLLSVGGILDSGTTEKLQNKLWRTDKQKQHVEETSVVWEEPCEMKDHLLEVLKDPNQPLSRPLFLATAAWA